MKNKQGITIAALIAAIIGLSIGFAAFSNTLTINSNAGVNPDSSSMNVVFSSSNNGTATQAVVPTKNAAATSANIGVTNATITGRTLSNLSAAFTAPGQSITYETNLYVYNAGSLKAQLTGIVFNEAEENYGSYKKCVAATKDSNNQDIPQARQATPTLVTSACEGISISVTIGTATDVTPSSTGDKASLNYQTINAGSALAASVTISYDGVYIDGPMEVIFGDIEITATSAVDETRVVAVSSPSSPSTPESNIVACSISENVGSSAITTGDKIICGTESFYVIEDLGEGSTVKMLSEWNLDTTIGMQSRYNQTSVAFDSVIEDSEGYWTTGENHDLNTSIYTQNNNGDYPAYVYNNIPSIKGFVDAYVGYLNSELSINATGRLITYEEIETLGCSGSNHTCVDSPATAPSWVYKTTYWTGSAGGEVSVWRVHVSGEFQKIYYHNDYCGVRPVIEISADVIETQ